MNFSERPTYGHLTHYGYVVDDIEKAVDLWSKATGAGPFFLMENIHFDHIESRGESVVFKHSAAMGQWGPIAIEFDQIDELCPESLLDNFSFIPGPKGVGHISYITPDLGAAGKELEALGCSNFLDARIGEFEVALYDMPEANHAIELYRENEFVHEFFRAIKAQADGWDGTYPLRAGLPF